MMDTTRQHLAEASNERSSPRAIILTGYTVAIFAASVATFGESGVAFGVIVAAFWVCIFGVRSHWLRTGAIIVLSVLLVAALLPQLDHGPAHLEATRRMGCTNNLKSIAMALHNYHDVYKSFPPAYVEDEDGRRMHSWRVLILPYLEGQQRLSDAYKFDEPWDGPNNRELIPQMPRVFCCPSQCRRGRVTTGITSYFAVVGENTVWPGERSSALPDIVDGTSNTLLLLEVINRPTAWTEPVDIEFADATTHLADGEAAPHRYEGFFRDQPGGSYIALADGSIRFIAQQADATSSKLLIQRNDGECFDVDLLDKFVVSPMPLHVGNCIRLGVFSFLVLVPFAFVWLKRCETNSETKGDEG